MPGLKNLDTIILAPVLLLLVIAGAGLLLLISRSVDEFANRSIRDNLTALSRTVYDLADGELDICNVRAVDCLDGSQRTMHQLSVFQGFDDFARQNGVGVVVINSVNGETSYVSGLADPLSFESTANNPPETLFRGQDGIQYYTRSVAFAPWNWKIILFKDAEAFVELKKRVLGLYVGTGVIVILIAGALALYLRRAIARPINQIVASLREQSVPAYNGIREFEFMSDHIGRMMHEVASHRDHLQDLVNARTSELEEARTRLTNALDNISEGFALYDADDRLVLSNPKYREIMHLPGTEDFMLPGTSFEKIIRTGAERGLIRDATGRIEEWIAERLRAHRNPGPPYIQQRANGRWVQVSERQTVGGGTVSVYTDITSTKDAEIELRVLKERAEDANAAKTEFLRHVTHDIRSPMNYITGFARKIKEHAGDVLPAKQQENLERILVSANHLSLLINDLLDMSRLETGKAKVENEVFDLTPFVYECLRFFEQEEKIVDGRLRLANRVSEDTSKLCTDKAKLQQIVVNLLSNAVRFADDGEIVVSAGCTDGHAEISVTDTGIGIPAEQLDVIFDEFHQVADRTSKPRGGTGLGLAICRKLATLLGAEVSVVSTVGKGSTFTVRIPAAATGSPPNGRSQGV